MQYAYVGLALPLPHESSDWVGCPTIAAYCGGCTVCVCLKVQLLLWAAGGWDCGALSPLQLPQKPTSCREGATLFALLCTAGGQRINACTRRADPLHMPVVHCCNCILWTAFTMCACADPCASAGACARHVDSKEARCIEYIWPLSFFRHLRLITKKNRMQLAGGVHRCSMHLTTFKP